MSLVHSTDVDGADVRMYVMSASGHTQASVHGLPMIHRLGVQLGWLLVTEPVWLGISQRFTLSAFLKDI